MTVGSQVKNCFAAIKGIEATLNILAHKTQNKEAKQTFYTVEQMINEIKNDLEKQVTFISIEEPQYKN